MTNEKLYEVIDGISEKHIKEAKQVKNIKNPVWLKWVAAAACLCLVVVGVFAAHHNGDGALDYAETVIYNGAEYVVCGTGEAAILEECGLPSLITEDLAGEHLGYLEQGEKNTYAVADDLKDSSNQVELFEYAPGPNDNVYILCVDGKYYAAIRRDTDGYHGLTDTQEQGITIEKCPNESAGVITFYSDPVEEAQRSDTHASVRCSVEFDEERANKVKEIIDGIDTWANDYLVDRLSFYFDGNIEFADREFVYYFAYEYNVIYYDHYFAEISAEEMQLIKDIAPTDN